MKSVPFKDDPCSADLAVEIRGLSALPLTDSTSPSAAASPRRAGPSFGPDLRPFLQSRGRKSAACFQLGRPFYGWCCAPACRWFFPALGRCRRSSGAWGGATARRPRRPALRRKTPPPVTSPPKSHPLHSTPLTAPDPLQPSTPAVPWKRSPCSQERNHNHGYTRTNQS